MWRSFKGTGIDESLKFLENWRSGRNRVLKVKFFWEFGLEVVQVDKFEELESRGIICINFSVLKVFKN